MVERLPSDAELDALIEAALAEEVLLPVPRDLQARVCERVQLAALQQRELARFRNALLSGFVASVGVLATLAALVLFTKFDVLLKHGISGGQGLMDSYAATFALSWPYYMETFALALVLGLGGATLWAGLMPLRWLDGMHGHGNRSGKSVAQGPFQTP